MSILLLLTIILSSVSGGYDKYLGIEELAHTTVKGYKQNSINKYLLMNGFVNLTTVMVLILNYMKVSSNFSLDTKAPLLEVINVSSQLTVFQGYIFLSINVLIVTNTLFYITYKLSKHFDYIFTMMATFMITFIMLWIGVFTKLPSLLDLLSSQIFNNFLLVILVELVILGILLFYYLFTKKKD